MRHPAKKSGAEKVKMKEQNIILGRTVSEVLSNFSYRIDIIWQIFLYVEVIPSVLYQIILRN